MRPPTNEDGYPGASEGDVHADPVCHCLLADVLEAGVSIAGDPRMQPGLPEVLVLKSLLGDAIALLNRNPSRRGSQQLEQVLRLNERCPLQDPLHAEGRGVNKAKASPP